jgi:hypothetical protein
LPIGHVATHVHSPPADLPAAEQACFANFAVAALYDFSDVQK